MDERGFNGSGLVGLSGRMMFGLRIVGIIELEMEMDLDLTEEDEGDGMLGRDVG